MHLPFSHPALGHFKATKGDNSHHTKGKGCLNPLAAIGYTLRDVLGGVYTQHKWTNATDLRADSSWFSSFCGLAYPPAGLAVRLLGSRCDFDLA
jgi:hypothetical protein